MFYYSTAKQKLVVQPLDSISSGNGMGLFALVLRLCILLGCALHGRASSRPCYREGRYCIEYTVSTEKSSPDGCRDTDPLDLSSLVIEYREVVEEVDSDVGEWKRLLIGRTDSKLS